MCASVPLVRVAVGDDDAEADIEKGDVLSAVVCGEAHGRLLLVEPVREVLHALLSLSPKPQQHCIIDKAAPEVSVGRPEMVDSS